MPVFFQHQINESTRLGVWKIEEPEAFFKGNVPQHRDVTHPHKRLQHLAGRFLLQYLFPGFPYALIQLADTRKPFLPGEEYHFSISHCGDYAAAIVSTTSRVGVDIEIPTDKVNRIRHKFMNETEQALFADKDGSIPLDQSTLCWSAKEAVFKWYGDGEVDFRRHILVEHHDAANNTLACHFDKTKQDLLIHYCCFDELVLAWVSS